LYLLRLLPAICLPNYRVRKCAGKISARAVYAQPSKRANDGNRLRQRS